MSEKAADEPKKKGKLPVVLILAIVLGAGGFFGMKMRGGDAKKEEPKIELGPIVEIKDEFLTNMADRTSYVRTKISLQFRKDFKAEHLEEEMAAIQDVINMQLQATSPKDVSTPAGMRHLKESLATSINKLLKENEPKEEKDEDSKKKKKKKSEDDEDGEVEIPEGWDSAEGPVLKVLFVSFATQ